ncbi:MAG: hypothetical protein GXP62_04020 [Oligoflexia bacterium]|nr:hypothetical protein [Oligoflexia bacterium]
MLLGSPQAQSMELASLTGRMSRPSARQPQGGQQPQPAHQLQSAQQPQPMAMPGNFWASFFQGGFVPRPLGVVGFNPFLTYAISMLGGNQW